MSDTARIETDITAARKRLEVTVNELAYRAQPKVIASRQARSLKLALDSATHTPDGALRVDRVAAAAAVVVAALVAVVLIRRRR